MARSGAGGPAVGRRTVLAGATGTAALAGYPPGPGRAPLPAKAPGGARVPSTAALAAAPGAEGPVVRVTVEVQKASLVQQLHAYFADPSGLRNQRDVVKAVSDPRGLGLSPALLEALLLEGDLTPAEVDEFVTGMLASYENVNLLVR
jgi:hypothetical protein